MGTGIGITGPMGTGDGALATLSAELTQTGQTVSYTSGDDPTRGRATDFLTLPDNNPFGNLNRHTATDGTQVLVNSIVLDWITFDGTNVRGYYLVNLGFLTWAVANSTAEAHTIGAFTSGWRLWNRIEVESLINDGVGTKALNYAHFVGVNRFFWVNMTYSLTTTSAFRYDQNQWIRQAAAKTGSNDTYATRSFTLTELGL